MSKDPIEARHKLYCNLMGEVKARLDTIADLVGSDDFAPPIRYEFGYLQLRMICEIIAIACLTAHGDVIASKNPKLRFAWQAGEIIKGLEKLHKDFYPQPTNENLSPGGSYLVGITVVEVTDAYLSKRDLLSLYGRCGDILHRGNLNDIAPRKVSRDDLLTVVKWHNKILKLLNRHFIEMADSNGVYVALQDKITKGVHLMQLTRSTDPGGVLLRRDGPAPGT
jgi:hypothetical protein